MTGKRFRVVISIVVEKATHKATIKANVLGIRHDWQMEFMEFEGRWVVRFVGKWVV